MSDRLNASPIEDYLDDLTLCLRHESPRRARHLVSEAEAHLYDLAAALVSAGAKGLDAEAEAVARFGSAHEITRAEGRVAALPTATIITQIGLSGLFLGSLGAVAVGASGLIAGLIRLIGGTGAIVDLSSGPPLTAANCARWLSSDSSASSCQAAAVGDWADETVFYRIALGIVGLIMLSLSVLAHRVLRRRGARPLPQSVSDTIAASLFIVAGVWTLGLGIDAVVLDRASGQWFSAAIVSLVAGLLFGLRLIDLLRAGAGDTTLIKKSWI